MSMPYPTLPTCPNYLSSPHGLKVWCLLQKDHDGDCKYFMKTEICPEKLEIVGTDGYTICGLQKGHKADHQFILNARYCINCDHSMERGLNGLWECVNIKCIMQDGEKNTGNQFTHAEDMKARTIYKGTGPAAKVMNQNQYFAEFKKICTEMCELTNRKNSDYAEEGNAFANFETIEQITDGRVSAEAGILVRLTDKIKRIGSLIARPPKVIDEKLTDTVMDLAVYSIILLIRLRMKHNVANFTEYTAEK